MTAITGTLYDTSGTAVAGIAVSARLVAASVQLTAGGQVIRAASTTSGVDGTWSLTLTPLSSLAYSTGAYYVVEADGRRWTVTVPDSGTYELGDVLVDVPTDRAEVGLTQTAADARYVELAGDTMTGALVLSGAPSTDLHAATKAYVDAAASGGTASDTVAAETSYGVAASAGVATAYSRGDHTHGSPTESTPASIGAVPTSRLITASTGLTGGGDLTADRSLAVSYGSSASTACEGNDSRLSDARTPTTHASTHASAGSDPVTPAAIGAAPQITLVSARVTSGDTTLPNTSGAWAALSGFAIAISAAVGDVVELAAAALRSSATPANAQLDLAIVVGGSIVRYCSTGTSSPATEGNPDWYPSNTFIVRPAPWALTLVSGDIDTDNQVHFVVAVKSTGTGTLYSSTSYPFRWHVKNYGPGA